MHQSPRIRRLRSDLAALERLRSESSVFRFTSTGDPPQQYNIVFTGKSLWRDRGKVKALEQHRVEIKLGASYPRSVPEIRWLTPIFHPNISEIGMVCLGGYGTHWVPSVQLDDLCVMLWDMARYHNYDIRSPYNRESALWVAGQTTFRFPTDARPLRDLRASQGRADSPGENVANDGTSSRSGRNRPANTAVPNSTSAPTPVARVLQFIERYGRGPNDAPQPGPERRNMTDLLSRIAAEGSRGRESNGRPSNSASDLDVPEGASRPTIAAPLEPTDARATPPTTSPEAGHGCINDDQDDVIILETSSDEIRQETARSGNDEVIFIS